MDREAKPAGLKNPALFPEKLFDMPLARAPSVENRTLLNPRALSRRIEAGLAKPTGVLKALLKTGELSRSMKSPSLEKVLPVKPGGFRKALLKNGERNCEARSASVETLTLLKPRALSSRISAGVVRPKLLALMKNLLLTSCRTKNPGKKTLEQTKGQGVNVKRLLNLLGGGKKVMRGGPFFMKKLFIWLGLRTPALRNADRADALTGKIGNPSWSLTLLNLLTTLVPLSNNWPDLAAKEIELCNSPINAGVAREAADHPPRGIIPI